MKKRIIAMILSIVMVIGMIPMTVFAADVVASGYCGGEGDGTNLTWELDSSGVLRISGTGTMANYSTSSCDMPWYAYAASINKVFVNENVTSIGDGAFYSCYNMTDVSIANSVNAIGYAAFQNCYGLTKAVIPSGVETIADSLFYNCFALQEVILPDTITKIGMWSFYECGNLRKIILPNNIENIGRYAFHSCKNLLIDKLPNNLRFIGDSAFGHCDNVTSFVIPKSVVSISDGAFRCCEKLTSITVEDGNAEYCSIDGVLFNIDKSRLIQYPSGKSTTSYEIPNTVIDIGGSAFEEAQKITNIVISDNVETIGLWAFSKCDSLQTLFIPDSVSYINGQAFLYCKGFIKITVSENNSNYSSDENGVLFNKQKTHLYLYPSSNQTSSYKIPNTVSAIEGYAFYGCSNLKSIYIPTSVNYIYAEGFDSGRFIGATQLTDVYYAGSEDQWNSINIGSGNNSLLSATIHYNSYDDSSATDDPNTPNIPSIPSDTANYAHFGKLDAYDYTGSMTIDGITYQMSDEYKNSASNIQKIFPDSYTSNYYYMAYNLNGNNEITEATFLAGFNCELEDWDASNKIVDTDYALVSIGGNNTLPTGSYYVSNITADDFPINEIGNWIGDQIRIYSAGEQIYKVIHITALTGTVTSFDALSSPQKVYIDNAAYTIAGNDLSLVEQCRTNQFNEVIAVLYDGVVVQLISVDEAVELQVALGLGSNSRVRYSNGTYQRNSTLDRTNQISVKVSLSISEYFNDNLNCLKSLHDFDTLINAISIKSLSNGISFAGNDTVDLHIPFDKQLLTIGESLRFTTSFNFNNSYVPYNNELMHINCEVTGVQNNKNVSAYANTHFTIITKESDTSESTGGNEEDKELQEIISDNKDELIISGSFAWDSLFKTNFLTDAQADQIKYAIMSAVASTTLPEDTFDDYVAEKVLSQFCKYNNYGLGVENIDVTVPIRIDTKKYGDLIINLTYSGPSFFMSRLNFGSLVTINYEIVDGENIDEIRIPLKGLAGVGTIYNLKSFAQAVENIAKAEVKSAVKLPSGIGVAKKIAELSEFKELVWAATAMDIIKTVGDAKDIKHAGWEIITYPMKLIKFDCPINIYVYNDSETLLAQVTNDIGESFDDNIIVDVRGGAKYFTIIGEDDYSFEIKATANGTMDITVDEMAGFERSMRTIAYYDLPLTIGNAYEALTNLKLLTDTPFTLTRDGSIITPNEDVKHTSTLDDTSSPEDGPDDTIDPPSDDSGFDEDYWYWTLMLLYSQEFDITASATEGGTITPAGISKVKYDKNITYTITPNEGYAIVDVLVDGKSVGAVSEYTIKRVKTEHTINAIFVKTAWENPYADVSDETWYYEDIEFVSENGLMIGTGGNKFSPNAIVNRAMLVTVLWRLEGSPVVNSPVDFYDVPADEWYTAAVNWAAANGIVNGYGDGIFGAMNDLTHEQIMAILNRYAVYKKCSDNVSGNADDSYTNSEWAENNVLWADLNGMFNDIGSDISDLTEGADRAELAAYLRRFCERFMAE